MRDRTRSPAPAKSTTATAISTMARAERTVPVRPVVVRVPLAAAAVSGMSAACHAGASPARMPAATVIPAANSVTRQSSDSAIPSGSVPGGSNAGAERSTAAPSASPAVPPTAASSRLSVSSCRKSCRRLAPSAARTASSRVRPTPRASSRFATFAHAMSSTNPTTPANTSDVVLRSLPTSALCKGSIVTPQPLLVDGEMRAMPAAIEAISARARSMEMPDFNRPNTCR